MLTRFDKWEVDDSIRWTDDTKTPPHQKTSKKSKPAKLLFLLIAASLLWPQSSAAQVKRVRRVLILNVFGPLSSPGVSRMDEAIVASLEQSPYQIELYTEDMEATLFPDEDSQQQFREWYIHKYRDRKPDVIIAVGLEPLRFMVASHAKFFPGIPVIFCGLTEEMLDGLKLDPQFTGVWSVAKPEQTLKAALALQPGTRQVVVVGGVGAYDRHLEAVAKESFRKYDSRLEFTYLTDLGMPALIERLKHLPDHTIVYHTSIMQDAEGAGFIDANQSVPIVASAAHAPVFVVDDVDLGKGTVGGYLLSFAAIGKTVAQMTVRVLNGEKPQDTPIVRSPNVYMFDWRALKRWGLNEADLPPGSIVLNREPTVWETYKWYIIGGIALILMETLLIVALLWQRARRRAAETELAISNHRVRLAVEAGKSVGWDWDAKTGINRWFGDLQTMFGIESDTHSGQDEDFQRMIYPEDREPVQKAIADALQNRKPYAAEFRVVRTNGTVRWVTARGQFHYSNNGDPARMLGMAVDITERKLVEEALANLSGRLIDAQEEERKRIAREIHDDYSQRLALLSLELENLAEESASESGQRLQQVWNGISEIGADLHSLSHRLHSSTLDSLGLVAGVKALCTEFAEQQEIEVDFADKNIPRDVPGDVALCLFRIVQEGLRNIKRHSGADRADVCLESLAGKLHLSVADRGRGFDVNNRLPRDGIGIRSMEERLRSLGGQLEVTSRPMEGTRIHVSVPLAVANESAA